MSQNNNWSKTISKVIFGGIILLFMSSCRTAYYAPTYVYDNKIPPVSPEIDWLSIETYFRDGTTHASGTAAAVSTTYNYGSVSSSYGAGSSYSTSTYIKNPQIKYLRDRFTSETFNISEKFGSQQGSIVWSVEYYNRYQTGAGASKALVGITLGVGAIFHLLGVPWCSYTGTFAVKADILDRDRNYIASYSSGKKIAKYYVAVWWGYSGSSARNMAFINPLNEAINEVKSKIINDADKITGQLDKD